MKLISIIILMLLSKNGNSQCSYSWIKTYNGISDTLIRNTNCIDIDDTCKHDIDFNKIIPTIRKSKIEDIQRIELIHLLDSLKNLPNDSSLTWDIKILEHDLNSQFQILKCDTFELALYAMDTLTLEDKQIVIYAFSSNFRTDWNEDHNNWFFYYTPQFGIIEAEYSCIWSSEYPCFVLMSLDTNCKVDNNNRDHFIKMKDYIRRTRFRN